MYRRFITTLMLTASLTLATAPPALATSVVRCNRYTMSVPQVIAREAAKMGCSKTDIAALVWIARRESGFRPTAVNPSGCYGLFQLSWGMCRGNPWSDPAWNTRRAIRYMRGRYGSVQGAKRFWLSHHWY